MIAHHLTAIDVYLDFSAKASPSPIFSHRIHFELAKAVEMTTATQQPLQQKQSLTLAPASHINTQTWCLQL
jgi:hypothetical protein